MKVIYVAPFYDGTGFANAAINTVLGMDAAGINIIPYTVKLTAQVIEPPDRIKELEKLPKDSPDVVIHHMLPMMMSYWGGAKNIAYCHLETTNFESSNWQYYLNCMDEIWVCCEENRLSAERSGITKPIKVIPIPFDLEIYKKHYAELPLNIDNSFGFYSISDWSSRKNISNLVKCYLEEFTRYDNVKLILKTYKESTSAQQSSQEIANDIAIMKNNLRKYGKDLYPPITLLCDYMPDLTIKRLHKTCNCYVSAEQGAAWNIPAFEAMAFGNQCITNGWGGQNQFSDNMTDYKMVNVYGMGHCPYGNLYTCYEQWGEPDYDQLKQKMREAYNKGKIKVDNFAKLEQFNLVNAGNRIKQILK